MEIEQKYNRLTRKWEPKTWLPKYEEIVLLKVQGWKNKQIANKLGCTPQSVANVLSCKQGRKLIAEYAQNIRNQGMSLAERKIELGLKAFERVEDYFKDDTEYEKRKGAMVDRAMKLMQGTGELKPDVQNNTNNVVIGTDALEILTSAIEKSSRVRAKYGIPVQSEVVIGNSGERNEISKDAGIE